MTINPVIGDEGFERGHGRMPRATDSSQCRVACHLAYVEARLRTRRVSSRLLDRLRTYWNEGVFPLGESRAGYQPTWIDSRGVRCAVAHLAEADLGEAAIRDLDGEVHNAVARTFRSPLLARWAASHGLTPEDLAWIQPAYPPMHTDLDVDVAAEYRQPVARDEMKGDAPMVGTGDLSLRYRGKHNYYVGTPVIGLDAAVGTSSDGLAYDAKLRLGSEVTFYPFGNGHGHRIGATAGFGLDAVGARIERAWTVPIDAYWYIRSSAGTRVGFIAGPRFTIVGDRELGGRVGVDVALRDVWRSDHPLAPRDLHLRAGVEHMADVTFVGVALSIAARGRFDYYSGW